MRVDLVPWGTQSEPLAACTDISSGGASSKPWQCTTRLCCRPAPLLLTQLRLHPRQRIRLGLQRLLSLRQCCCCRLVLRQLQLQLRNSMPFLFTKPTQRQDGSSKRWSEQ